MRDERQLNSSTCVLPQVAVCKPVLHSIIFVAGWHYGRAGQKNRCSGGPKVLSISVTTSICLIESASMMIRHRVAYIRMETETGI